MQNIDLDAIRQRAESAASLAGYGGRPPEAQAQLGKLEAHYSVDVLLLLDQIAKRDDLLAATRTVVEAARRLRATVGNANKHGASCQDSPCDVCDDLGELEEQAGLDLDLALQALNQA